MAQLTLVDGEGVHVGGILQRTRLDELCGNLCESSAGDHSPSSRIVLGIFWVTAAVVLLMALDQDPYLLGALLGAGNFLAPTANTILISYQVALTPDSIQGKVNAAGYFLASAVSPAAPVTAGVLLSSLGGPGTLLVIATATALTALVATASRTMRRIPDFSELVPS